MNSAKLACDFLGTNLTLENLAKKYSVDKSDIVKAIRKYRKSHLNSNLSAQLDRKLKIILTKNFLSFTGRRDDFAIQYGLSEKEFVTLMLEVIEDTCIVRHDILANKIFLKLTLYKTYSSASVPNRIVRIIAEYYVDNEKHMSQDALASIYGIQRSSISSILRRGIAEGIVDDELANKIYSKVRNCKYATNAMIRLYDVAFDKREQLTCV